MDTWKITLVFSSKREILTIAILTIAIAIIVLTNKYRTKNSLLWQNIGDIVVRGYREYMVTISDNGPGWK